MNNKNISKLKKIIPISFIVVFATFLAIPNTGLYRGEKNARLIAQTENRRITPRPTQSLKSKMVQKGDQVVQTAGITKGDGANLLVVENI